MTMRLVLLLAFGSLCGCPKQAVVLDPLRPHRLSRDVEVKVWVSVEEGKMIETPWQLRAGDWCATAGAIGEGDGKAGSATK